MLLGTVWLPFLLNAQITISGINSTVSTCPNNGSITVSASSPNPPLLYSIVAGPVTQPVQSNSVFNSLPPGTYTVKITDGAGNSVTQQVTITGTYTNPDFTAATVKPYCLGDSNGELTGSPVPGTGLAPFTWQLMSPSPVTTAPQTGNHFGNLPAGNYTVRLADACGSYKTSVITLTDPNTQNPFYGGIIANKVGCDTMHFQYSLQTFDLRLPLTFKYETSGGTYTYTTPTAMSTTAGYCHVEQVIPGISYGETVTVTVYNACGDSTSTWVDINPFHFSPTVTFDSCGTIAHLSFVLDPYVFDTGLMPPIHYTVTELPTNIIVEQGSITVTPPATINSTFINGITVQVEVGDTYRIDITDGCGDTFTDTYTVPNSSPPSIINKSLSQRACIDSVAGLYVIETAGFTNAKLILTSGPATLGSSKPGFAYADTYSYPDTLIGSGNFWLLQNLALGTYYFTIIDECGYQVSDSIVIMPIHISSLVKELSYKKGCLGQNSIYFGMLEEGRMTVTHIPSGAVLKVKNVYSNNIAYNRDSVTNVASGLYEVLYEYKQGGFGTYINDSLHSCWTIRDTIDIEDYQNPEMTTGNTIMCNEEINLVLFPDTTKGVPAYHYEIIAGPQTFPEQASNVFSVDQAGTYTARIYDACGNASIKQITVDTLSFDPVQSFATCNNAVFSFTPSDYFTYLWQMPNGQTHSGDTLIISPVTAADTGVYQVTKVITINGCTDTTYTDYHLTLGIQVRDTVHFCLGNSVSIGTNTYTLPGIYTDTLVAVGGCDSIVTNHLIEVLPVADTVQVSLCQGDSLLIGGIYRYVSGFYADSVLNLGGCYDVTVTDLRVQPATDTVQVSICNGEGYTWGNTTYQTAGTYTEVFVSALGCDSIRVLALSIRDYAQHKFVENICPGEYFVFGADTLTQTGVYADTLSTATCDSIVTLYLYVVPGPSVSIGANTFPTLNGAQVYLQANSNTHPLTYVWTSDAVLSNHTIANPSAHIQGPTWVYLTITDANGCTDTAQYQMTIPNTSTLYIPNTYTPNGDPTNPLFRVYGTNIEEFEMRVFNRWGELIFQTTDMDFGWNGTYKGETVQSDIYVYKVLARGMDNTQYNHVGQITVLR